MLDDDIDDIDDTIVRRPDAARAADVADAAGPTAPTPVSSPASGRVPSIRVRDRVVRLDRAVIVGRRPRAPRIVIGQAPELVMVPSRNGEVSGSHVLIHAEGTVVVVEDLHSTNGTVVRQPGGAPIRMRAGASIVVLTGTVVDIGDGNAIEILSPHLRFDPSASSGGPVGAAASSTDIPGLSGPIRPIPGFHN